MVEVGVLAWVGSGSPPLQLRDSTGLSPVSPSAAGDSFQSGLGSTSLTKDGKRAFLRRFSRLTLLELLMLVLEVVLLAHLWVTGTMAWLCAGLLAKDLLLLALSAAMARPQLRGGLFEALLGLPRWLVWTDRASALVSGLGGLILLLAVNEFWF